jgi:hypothetical protein
MLWAVEMNMLVWEREEMTMTRIRVWICIRRCRAFYFSFFKIEFDFTNLLHLHRHLMVRHGLLSPNSKLLPGAASRSATPLDDRPMSVISNGGFFLSFVWGRVLD